MEKNKNRNTISGKIVDDIIRVIPSKSSIVRSEELKSWKKLRGGDINIYMSVNPTNVNLYAFKTTIIPDSYIVVIEDIELQVVSSKIMTKTSIKDIYSISI